MYILTAVWNLVRVSTNQSCEEQLEGKRGEPDTVSPSPHHSVPGKKVLYLHLQVSLPEAPFPHFTWLTFPLSEHWNAMPREDFCDIMIYDKYIHLLFWHKDPKAFDIS